MIQSKPQHFAVSPPPRGQYQSQPQVQLVDYSESGTNSEGNHHGQTQVTSKMEEVRSWMTSIVELPEYTQILIDNGFDSLKTMGHLSEEVRSWMTSIVEL